MHDTRALRGRPMAGRGESAVTLNLLRNQRDAPGDRRDGDRHCARRLRRSAGLRGSNLQRHSAAPSFRSLSASGPTPATGTSGSRSGAAASSVGSLSRTNATVAVLPDALGTIVPTSACHDFAQPFLSLRQPRNGPSWLGRFRGAQRPVAPSARALLARGRAIREGFVDMILPVACQSRHVRRCALHRRWVPTRPRNFFPRRARGLHRNR